MCSVRVAGPCVVAAQPVAVAEAGVPDMVDAFSGACAERPRSHEEKTLKRKPQNMAFIAPHALARSRDRTAARPKAYHARARERAAVRSSRCRQNAETVRS